MNLKRVSIWLLAATSLLAFAACSSSLSIGPTPAPGEDAQSVPFEGTLTLEDYDWFATDGSLGVIDLALPSGEKTRILDGANPWRHPSGRVVFTQSCGEDVNLIAVSEGGPTTPITPCSSEIGNPGASPTLYAFSRLSPDQQKVAVEARFYLDGAFRFSLLVFDLSGGLLATFNGAAAPAWTPDGRLLFAADGIYLTDAQLQNPVRVDGGQISGVGNMDVNPAGTLVAFEYNQQIWLLDLNTAQVRQAVTGPKRLRYPTFSPDGATLAYLATPDSDRYDQAIYFNNLQTGESYALEFPADPINVSNVPNGPLSWTP